MAHYEYPDMSTLPRPSSSVRQQFDLTGRVVLISGGAGFLGGHFAAALGEMGAHPVLLDREHADLEAAVARLAERAIAADSHPVDITDGAGVVQAVADIVAAHGRIDVLLNAAGFAMKSLQEGGDRFFAPFEEYDEALWQISQDVNLTGTFLVTQAVGRQMKEQGRGAIINICSDLAVIAPDQRIYQPDPRVGYDGVAFNTPANYPVSKAGLLAFTRYLATYWARDGIRVNAISPAGVYRDHDKAFVDQLASRIPLGRMAFPEELMGPVVFLASDASSFMTGANLMVDGGRTIW
jgi:NAD(P)-dependent dehydrogenase (short-subunit alcohol dehydrogenase family)